VVTIISESAVIYLSFPSGSFNDDANYDSRGTQGTDPDSTFSESYGGSGTGQAGGYTGSQHRVGGQGQQGFGGGDNYCDSDPGMAGNRGTQDLNVPVVGRHDSGSHGQTIGGGGRSRGYERDAEEYDDSGTGGDQDQCAGDGRGPKPSLGSKLMGSFSFCFFDCVYILISVDRRSGKVGWQNFR